jgi:hypothetical protein
MKLLEVVDECFQLRGDGQGGQKHSTKAAVETDSTACVSRSGGTCLFVTFSAIWLLLHRPSNFMSLQNCQPIHSFAFDIILALLIIHNNMVHGNSRETKIETNFKKIS